MNFNYALEVIVQMSNSHEVFTLFLKELEYLIAVHIPKVATVSSLGYNYIGRN